MDSDRARQLLAVERATAELTIEERERSRRA
jgi:hypothetical protein